MISYEEKIRAIILWLITVITYILLFEEWLQYAVIFSMLAAIVVTVELRIMEKKEEKNEES